MADAPSTILLLRLQSTGSNTNLWGGYLNTALQTLEQAAKGFQTLNVAGDATVAWSNYAVGNVGQAARLRLTGALTGPATLTFPAYQNFVSVENDAGAHVTLKCAGGTGVALGNGQRALVYCDGVDYFNAAPTRFPNTDMTFAGRLRGVAAAIDGADATNLAQVNALIASGAVPGAPGTVKVDAASSPVYLGAALTAGEGFHISDDGDSLGLSVTPYWNGPRVVASADSPVAALDRDIIEVRTSTGAVVIDLPATGRVKIVDIDGAAAANNITVDPPGADTATFDVIDTDHFSGVWQRRPAGTVWDLL